MELHLSSAEQTRLAQCAKEVDKLLSELFTINEPCDKSKLIYRDLRQLLPIMEALTNVSPVLRAIIDAKVDGAGYGLHQEPASAHWPKYREEMHEAAHKWLKTLSMKPLNPTEKKILSVCQEDLDGCKIANRIKRDYGHTRRVLSDLVDAGRLEKTQNGYRTVRAT